MNSNEPDTIDSSPRQNIVDAADQNPPSGWQKRRTVVRDVNLGSSLTSGTGKKKWDPNLWKLSYQGVLSLLRAEAFQAQRRQRADNETVNSGAGEAVPTEDSQK